jgi:hypothetical protein
MTLPYILSGIFAVLGQLSDCATTQIALSMGAHEGNPFMVWIVAHPLISFPLKTGFALGCLAFCQKEFAPKKSGIAPVLLVGLFGFSAALWNVWNILRS